MKNTVIQTSNAKQSFQLRRIRSSQAEQTFRLAVVAANKGNRAEAIELARETLFHARFHSSRLHIDAHALMANLLIDNAQYELARFHCWEAKALLHPSDYQFADDMAYFKALEASIARKNKQFIRVDSKRKAA